jgi:hypothetical protein
VLEENERVRIMNRLLNSVLNVQECDATGADNSVKAGNLEIIYIKKPLLERSGVLIIGIGIETKVLEIHSCGGCGHLQQF